MGRDIEPGKRHLLPLGVEQGNGESGERVAMGHGQGVYRTSPWPKPAGARDEELVRARIVASLGRMRVLCLRPPQVFHRWVSVSTIAPPIGLAYVAAAIRQAGYAVRCVDAMGEAPFQHTPVGDAGLLSYGLRPDQILARIAEEPSDVLAVTVMFSHDWPRIRALLCQIKAAQPQLRVVVGGEHPTGLPEFSLSDCRAIDVCVLGEGEAGMVAVLDAWRDGQPLSSVAGLAYRAADGRVERTPPRQRIAALDTLPWPAWDLLPLETYLDNGLAFGVNLGRTVPMLASRGCPFECTFCSSPGMWTTRWKARPVSDVIAEMAHYMDRYRATNFDFYDLTAVVRRDWILEFCREIVRRDWTITWQMPAGTRSEALDAEVLQWMHRAGHRHIVYAPETGSEETLRATKKKVDLGRMESSIVEAVRLGMKVKLNMMMGLPGETPRAMRATCRFLARMAWIGVTDMHISGFAPYPGSAEFRRMLDTGVIPALDDAYFEGLATIPNLTSSRSYSPYLSDRALTWWRIAGTIVFYGLACVRHPMRPFRTIWNVARRREQSRLDMALIQLRDRLFGDQGAS